MKALVFAAGLGTRLRPFTDKCPKALVEVGQQPMLDRVIRRLIDAGVTEVVVNVHHFGQMVIDYLTRRDYGIPVHISDERDLLRDTGGGLLKARHWLDSEDFIVHNADIFTDIPLSLMAAEHVASGADITLLVAPRESSRHFLFDADLCLKGWENNSTGEVKPPRLDKSGLIPLAFGGIHVISPRIFDQLERYAPASGVFSITAFYADMSTSLNIRAWRQPENSLWLDVGKPETLAMARAMADK